MNPSPFTTWRKSRRSDGASNCVEVAFSDDDRVGVRDSKDPTGPVLTFSAGSWSGFVEALKDGQFGCNAVERDL